VLPETARVTRRGLVLFGLMSVIWGIPTSSSGWRSTRSGAGSHWTGPRRGPGTV